MHILRSPFASAKIKRVDFSAATKKEGVITILSNQVINKLKINPMLPGFTVKNKKWKRYDYYI